MKHIDLDSITIDPALHAREDVNQTLVEKFAGLWVRGDEFPPVLLIEGDDNIWVGDGVHRILGKKLALSQNPDNDKLKFIEAIVRPGTREDAFIEQVRHNRGLSASGKADTRATVLKALNLPEFAEKNDRLLSKSLGISRSTVYRIRKEVHDKETHNKTKGQDGKNYPLTVKRRPKLQKNQEVQVQEKYEVVHDEQPHISNDKGDPGEPTKEDDGATVKPLEFSEEELDLLMDDDAPLPEEIGLDDLEDEPKGMVGESSKEAVEESSSDVQDADDEELDLEEVKALGDNSWQTEGFPQYEGTRREIIEASGLKPLNWGGTSSDESDEEDSEEEFELVEQWLPERTERLLKDLFDEGHGDRFRAVLDSLKVLFRAGYGAKTQEMLIKLMGRYDLTSENRPVSPLN